MNFIKKILQNKKIKISFLIIAVILFSFVGYKVFTAISSKLEEDRKIEARKIEKAECLKETPWQTLEGVTLCDTIWEIKNKLPFDATIKTSYIETEFGRVDIKNIEYYYGDKRYNISAISDSGQVYYIEITKTYKDIKPEYKKILQKIMHTNNIKKVDHFTSFSTSKKWCWGSGCKKSYGTVLDGGHNVLCEEKDCFLLYYSDFKPTFYFSMYIKNNSLIKDRVELNRKIKQQKSSEF